MFCLYLLPVKGAMPLLGDDARSCSNRITVDSPLLLTTGYMFPYVLSLVLSLNTTNRAC